jgi:UDP-2-acetamido-2-deoxy-ribo-hexuluronate aminotransferase
MFDWRLPVQTSCSDLDDVLAKAIREIRVREPERRYIHAYIGIGGGMDTLQPVIKLVNTGRFLWEIGHRLKTGALQVLTQRSDRTSVFAQHTVLVARREEPPKAVKLAGRSAAVSHPILLNERPACHTWFSVDGVKSA